MDEWINWWWWVDEWINWWVDEWINWWVDEWINWWVDEWINWWGMSGQMSLRRYLRFIF
jgi:hypothetical protein